MTFPISLIVILIGLVSSNTGPTVGITAKKCIGNRLPELPGLGWDLLTGKLKKRVLAINYSKCLESVGDGGHLLPDHVAELMHKIFYFSVDVIRQPVYDIGNIKDLFSEVDRMVDGLCSEDYEEEKKRRLTNGTATVRLRAKVVKDRLGLRVKTPLDSHFEKRVLQIVGAVGRNDTEMRIKLLERLVRDYGTHVVISEDIGSMLIVEDYLSRYYVMKDRVIPLKVTAMHVFAKDYMLRGDDRADTESYRRNRVWSRVRTVGGTGKPVNGSGQFSEWLKEAYENCTVVERKTTPLVHLINVHRFPDVDPDLLSQMRTKLHITIRFYYENNIHQGCSDPRRPNFNIKYNVDDLGRCDGPEKVYSFGGVYEKCVHTSGSPEICEEKSKANQLTGSFDCPRGHSSNLLASIPIETNLWKSETYRHCSGWGKTRKCPNRTRQVFHKSTATYSIYWCSGQGEDVPFSHFGGMYSINNVNPITGRKSCPQNHQVLASIADDQIKICGSLNVSHGYQNSGLFGGFVASCNSTECPNYYRAYYAGTVEHCNLHYCMQKPPLYVPGTIAQPHIDDSDNLEEDDDYDYYPEESYEEYEVLQTETSTMNIPTVIESSEPSIAEVPSTRVPSTEFGNTSASTVRISNGTSYILVDDVRNGTGQAFEKFDDFVGRSGSVKSEKESQNNPTLIICLVIVCIVALGGIAVVFYFKTKHQDQFWLKSLFKADTLQMELVKEEEQEEEKEEEQRES